MANINEIQSNKDNWSEEQLLSYLNGQLDKAAMHEVEKEMADSAFLNDAVEGLQHFKNKQDIAAYTEQLKRQVSRQTEKKKVRIKKRKYKQQDWIIMTIVIVILLCMLGYAAVKEFEKNKQRHQPTLST